MKNFTTFLLITLTCTQVTKAQSIIDSCFTGISSSYKTTLSRNYPKNSENIKGRRFIKIYFNEGIWKYYKSSTSRAFYRKKPILHDNVKSIDALMTNFEGLTGFGSPPKITKDGFCLSGGLCSYMAFKLSAKTIKEEAFVIDFNLIAYGDSVQIWLGKSNKPRHLQRVGTVPPTTLPVDSDTHYADNYKFEITPEKNGYDWVFFSIYEGDFLVFSKCYETFEGSNNPGYESTEPLATDGQILSLDTLSYALDNQFVLESETFLNQLNYINRQLINQPKMRIEIFGLNTQTNSENSMLDEMNIEHVKKKLESMGIEKKRISLRLYDQRLLDENLNPRAVHVKFLLEE